ncbi:MAG TPA: translocation/assembly module TamB domain-containing protein [Polyangiaceae bacterium]|nr:translocation/assembly module TamB domain-containing protein [Polyangiaceae bacterium]
MAVTRTRRRRVLGGLGNILSALGLTAVFGVGAAGALLAHLNLPLARRASADVLSSTLQDLFRGQVSIGAITQITPNQVEAQDIVVRDEAHRVVLKVTRLTAQTDLLDILKRVIAPREKLTIVINHVRVDRAEAHIIPAEDGLPTLAHAFLLRQKPSTEAPSDESQYVRVWLPAVEVGHAFARGSVQGSPTLEAEITGARGSLLASPKGAAIDVTRFALVARGVGGADAKGTASLHIRAPGAVWSNFDGYMGDVQFGSVVRWEKEALDLKLDVPRAEPAAMRALLAEWPLLVSTEARLRLSGKPPDLAVDLSAVVGEHSGVTATGNLGLADPPRLQLAIEGRRLDMRALWAQAPVTAIDVDTDLGLRQAEGKWVVDIGGALQPTTVEQLTIPAVDFSGSTESGTFVGQAKLHDLGLPVDLDFSIYPDGKIEVDAEAKRVNLAKVERIKPYFDGRGTADVHVRAALDHGRLDTSLTLDVRGLEYEGVALQSGRVVAGAKGPVEKLDQLALSARLTGKKLSAGRFGFEDVKMSAFGPLRAPTVTIELKDPNGPSFDARAKVTIQNPVSVRQLTLGISRDNVAIRGDIAQLDLSEDRVLVRDLRLYGATGELNGDAEITPESVSVVAQGQNLDLSVFSRVLGLPRGVLEGRASVNVDAVASGKTQRGSLELSVSKASILNLDGISGQLSAKLDGRQLSGAATGHVEALGGFSADWDTELAGPPTERASFEKALGSATLSLNDVTLDYLGQLMPETDVDIAGKASATLKLARREKEAVPDLELSGQTQGLRVTVARKEQPPLVISGIELLASAAHDGASGATTASLGVARGSERLMAISADMTLDPKAALEQKQPLVEQLRTRPLLAKVVVSEMQLDDLPGPLRLPGVRGAVRLEGTVRGSVNDPTASLSVRATDLRLSATDRAEPVDVCGTAEYAKVSGAFNVGAEVFLPSGLDLRGGACNGKRIANVRLSGTAPFDLQRGVTEWSGTALAALEGMPLAVIPALADARMTGSATGTINVDRSGALPIASAQIALSDVRADRLSVGSGHVNLRSNGNRARAEFDIQHGQAAVSGRIDAGLSWTTGLPALDDAQPIDTAVHASRLEASVLEPLLSDFVSELRGSVGGNLSARLEPLANGEESRRIEQVGGQITLQDGAFVLSGLGFRLRDVRFTANARRHGRRTLVEIPKLLASAGTKSQNMEANLWLELEGLDIASGRGSVNIDKLPLVVDGVTRAYADAELSLDVKRQPEWMFVDVRFKDLTAELPQEAPRDLIELNDNPNITVVQPITQPKGSRNQDELPWHFVLHFGNDARLERGELLKLPLLGDLNVTLAQALGVTGTVFLERGGLVRLFGKLFVIESGGVIFDTPDPKDPRLNVQASWRTPAGDQLFVYVTGTLSKPDLHFDRPESEAFALLLGTEAGDASSLGFSALESLLSDTPLARIQVRKSSGEEGATGDTYTAAYRWNERVIVEGNYQAAESTDSEETGNVGAAVDVRLGKNWSVRGQLGTIGTGVDLVYQYRY